MKSKFVYSNQLKKNMIFILEPWAEEFTVNSQEELTLVGEYENENAFCHFSQFDDYVVVYAWDHSLVRVYIGNTDVTKGSCDIRF